ncbi:MAG: molybdenum cofactor biosynthesis protein MoaE, partial [Verrucomicrobiota bacterium]|nr:molybdenum cofactor biosynthesis protein MoaE [Verrucomicrobiota bacterium]
MKSELTFTSNPINEAALAQAYAISETMGAVVRFIGVVRGSEGNNKIGSIEYEAFEPMARHQFELLFDALSQRWPIESVRLIHRIGVVPVNKPSLWVEVIAPHRAEAFDACQFLIDEMK